MRGILAACVCVSLAGCASIPPVTTHYYGTRSDIDLRVVRTVACDSGNRVLLASSVVPNVTYSANFAAPRDIRLRGIDGELSDTDLTIEYTPDGRLKSVNAISTGKGETILNAAIKLAGAALDKDSSTRKAEIAACKKFKARFGDKPQSVTYAWHGELDGAATTLRVPVDPQGKDFIEDFGTLLGNTCMTLEPLEMPRRPVELDADQTKQFTGVIIDAQQPARRHISVSIGPGSCETAAQIWRGNVAVSQAGTPYKLYVPKAAVFGKQTFAVIFDESGALTKLQYAKENGAPGLVSVAQTGFDTVTTTTGERTAAIKGEIDLIAAQQKLLACRADPKSC